MRKRLLTVLLAVILVIALGTVTAFADNISVSDEQELISAIDTAQNGDTVTLLEDITVNEPIEIDKDLTLDLNGHVIINNVAQDRVFLVNEAVDFTVDGTDDGSGMRIPDGVGSYGFIKISAPATVTLNGGNYVGDTDRGALVKSYNEGDENGNVIDESAYSSGCSVIFNDMTANTNWWVFTSDTIQEISLTVNGGNYTSTGEVVNKDTTYSVFSIDSISLTSPVAFNNVNLISNGGAGIEVCGGTATFTNCVFNINRTSNPSFTATAVSASYGGTANIISGNYDSSGYGAYAYSSGGTINVIGGTITGEAAALKADVDNNYKGAISTVNVTGGNINGKLETNGNEDANIIVSGGTFSQHVDEEFCAPGFVSIKNEDETYEVSLNPGIDLVAQIVNNSGHVIAAYENLSDATSRLTSGQTLQLLDDITNNDVETQRIYLPENAVLDGDGHTISGNVAVYANASGGIIEDVTFEDIHNSSNNLSAVYAPGLAGKLSITNCIFDNCDWDAIQITPIAGADISITGNTFSTDNADGIYQVRYVHIQSGLNVDFTATVTDNVMYDQIKGVNGAGADCGALEIYYFADPSKINASHNYIQYPELNCILATSGINIGEMAYPMYLDDELTQLSGTPVAAIKSGYTGTYFMTIEEALAAAEAGETVQFLTGTAGTGDITITLITGFTNDIVITNQTAGTSVELPELARSGYVLRGWSDGETTYRAGESYKVVEDATLTAVWGTAPNIPETYPITIADTDNGTVSTNLTNASAGATITITAEPDEGYSVGRVVVTGPDGRVDVTRVNATTYTFKMPEGDVEVEVEFVSGEEALPFTDVTAGAWYYDAVSYVYFNGMMEGDSATTFNPDGTMTRAMFWAVLGRIDGASITGSNWAEAAREWAVTNGVSDGENASGLVTREQMVTMLWRYAGEPESSYSLSAYSDAASVSDWAEEAMSWALENGIIEGMTATTLEPQSTATRAQCATIFMRYDALEA